MGYKVIYTENAVKKLKKADRATRVKIYEWIDRFLEGCENPREKGNALQGQYKGLWRYCVGDWRILAEISDVTVTILLVDAGNRGDIYKK